MSGIVRSIGWVTHDGIPMIRAIVDFPNNPPDGLTFATVWEERPVMIVEMCLDCFGSGRGSVIHPEVKCETCGGTGAKVEAPR